MRTLFLIAAITMLSGCASPPTVGEAVPAPNKRLLAYQVEDKGKDAAVTVVRGSDINGAGCLFAILVDGKLVARLGGDEKARFYLKQGRRLIGVGPDPEAVGRCDGSSSLGVRWLHGRNPVKARRSELSSSPSWIFVRRRTEFTSAVIFFLISIELLT